MAAPKINLPSPELQPPLAPYEHELNSNGECVKDCRACRWAKRTSDAPWNFMSPNWSCLIGSAWTNSQSAKYRDHTHNQTVLSVNGC